MGGIQPIALDGSSRAPQQACRFQWVRGEHCQRLAGGALAQQGLQRLGRRNGVEGIGIQHQIGRLLQHIGQPLGNGRSAAAAAYRHGLVARQGSQCLLIGHMTQHEPGIVHNGGRGVQQTHVHPACTTMQSGLTRQNGCALHAGISPDHAHIAKAAFVAGIWKLRKL